MHFCTGLSPFPHWFGYSPVVSWFSFLLGEQPRLWVSPFLWCYSVHSPFLGSESPLIPCGRLGLFPFRITKVGIIFEKTKFFFKKCEKSFLQESWRNVWKCAENFYINTIWMPAASRIMAWLPRELGNGGHWFWKSRWGFEILSFLTRKSCFIKYW